MRWCAVVKAKLTFFDKKMKMFLVNAVVLSKHSFGLIPKVFDIVDVIRVFCKFFGMVNSKLLKTLASRAL